MESADLGESANQLTGLAGRVTEARYRAQRQANTELIALYWGIGRVLAQHAGDDPEDAETIQRFSAHLRDTFPDAEFSPRSLVLMRSFSRAWPRLEVVQHPVAQLTWGHITVLLSNVADSKLRDWYVGQALAHGWASEELAEQIETGAHSRLCTALTSLESIQRSRASDLAQQIANDPDVFKFLRVEVVHAGQ